MESREQTVREQVLEGRVALVTGGSRGIGKAIALKLASMGATVVINYHYSKEKAEQVKTKIEAAGGKAMIWQCHVADYTGCEEMVKMIVEQYGRLDILVNNAGITRDRMLVKMSEEEFDEVIATNLKGTFNTIHFATPQMIAQGWGRIVNMTSISGTDGNIGQINYAAAKAGVIGMTKTAAKELARKGITVNAVAPGFIDTDMTACVPEKVVAKIASEIPMRRTGKPEQVADTVAFLVSEADYITGQVIKVTGGLSI